MRDEGPVSLRIDLEEVLEPGRRTGRSNMSNTTVLITDMAILVGIFLLGLIAKLFPKNGRNAGHKQ